LSPAPDRSRRPRALPLDGSLGLRRRGLLSAEILAAYIPLARRVRSNDIEAMVREARRWRDSPELPGEVARSTAIRLGRIVERLLRALPTDDRCLIRSLIVLRMLSERGIPATLVIGVRTDAGFGAHAWVEYDGWPVLPAVGFSPLLSL
jgi:hypothetical protein